MKWYQLEGQRFGRLLVIGVGKIQKVKHGTKKYWKCQCECGKITEVISHSLVTGHSKSCGCLTIEVLKARTAEKHPRWKGGRQIQGGYVKIWDNKRQSYFPEHRIIMSEFLKRPLKDSETVHHKNGNKLDNCIENLELWSRSHSEGQRVEDKVLWCVDFLREYAPEKLR